MGKKIKECDMSIRQAIIGNHDHPNCFNFCFNPFFECKRRKNKKCIFYSDHYQRPEPSTRPYFDFGLQYYKPRITVSSLKRPEAEPSERIKKLRLNDESDFKSKYPLLAAIGMLSI